MTRNILLLAGGIIVLILIFFGLGVLKDKGKYSVQYGETKFIRDQTTGFWKYDIYYYLNGLRGEYSVESRYLPTELEYIQVDPQVMNFFIDGTNKIGAVYLTFDPKTNESGALALAAADLAKGVRSLGVNVEVACTKNLTVACEDRPIINCEDPYPVIYIKEAESEEVSYEPHRCVVVSGKGMGLVKSGERLLFKWYGIMQ